MAKKFVNLNELDWDDSALLKAYDRCMKAKQLGEDLSETENEKESKRKWKVGDFCQALYPGDDLMYEAKILSLSDDTCVVDFLGYYEELEVDIATLARSKGKKSRKKQIKKACRTITYASSADESASDARNSVNSPVYSKKKIQDSNRGNHTFNQSIDYPAVESTFQAVYPPVPAHYNTAPAPTHSNAAPAPTHCNAAPAPTHCNAAPAPTHCNAAPIPPTVVPHFPSMSHCHGLSQNPALAEMLTAWYMAGYFTGSKDQVDKCGCHCHRASQNCRH